MNKERIKRTQLIERVSSAINKDHTALFAPPRGGKTLLLDALKDRFSDHTCLLLPLTQASMTPEFFALFTMNELLRCFDPQIANPRLDINIMISSAEVTCKPALPMIKDLENELQKIKPDYSRIMGFINDALSAVNKNKKLLVLIDDADELLNLRNFAGLKNVFELIGLKNKEPRFILATSHSAIMKKELDSFEKIEFDAFTKKEAESSFKQNPSLTDSNIEMITQISKLHPFILNRLVNSTINSKDISLSIINEILNPDSSLFQFMSSWINDALNRARGTTLQKAILQVLSRDGPLRLSELSRKIYRPAPVTKSLLERLMTTDVIVKQDKQFRFSSAQLERWYRIISSLPEIQAEPDDTKQIIKILEGAQ